LKEVFITLLWVIFIADSILLVLIVLLQSGRGGGLSGMLGGAGMAESALGPKSGLPKITGVMAAIFFLSAVLIGIVTRPRHIMDTTKTKKPAAEAAEPGPKPATEATPAGKEPPPGGPAGKGAGPEAKAEAGDAKAAPKAEKTGPGASPKAPATSTTPGTTP